MTRPYRATAARAFRFLPGACSPLLIVMLILLLGGNPTAAAAPPELAGLDEIYPALDSLYIDLHRNPELSMQEVKTAAKMANQLRALGFEVTEHVGVHGVVGVLRNGRGPTVMVRADMDALPVKEESGLPYASTVEAKNDAGETVPVMHACGHDVHMTAWAGAAALLARRREQWHGTLVFIAQPAEESIGGAAKMIADGLMTRFPKPDFVLGVHDTPLLPAGKVAVISGPSGAASTSVDVTFFGKGGHGAAPHRAIDPLLMAARAVVTLQTIVSREVNPRDPAVVTVGTFHAGTRRNIIPDEAKLELTVRSYKAEVQKQVCTAIERIAKAEAAAADAPREPQVTVHPQSADVVINDPAMAARLADALRRGLGEANVESLEAGMGSEDFGLFGTAAKAPSVQFSLGTVEPGAFAEAKAAGKELPGLHSPQFAPDRERTLRTGVKAMTLCIMELLNRPAGAQ